MADKLYSDLNKGTWSSLTAYTVGDFVDVNGSSYVCIANNTNQTPPDATYWALIASKGDAGDEIELQQSATHIQWRYVGGSWTDLVALSDLIGPQGIQGNQGIQGIQGNQGTAGKEVQIQVSGGYIQWKYDSDVSWTNLILVSTLKGDTGDNGIDGASSFTYIAYASDDTGTDFTLTFDANLDYIAIKHTTVAIPSPIASDFTGLWKNYKGETGATGPAGEGSGDVLGPATNNADYIPQWNGANSKTLKNGVAIPAGGLAGLTALGLKFDTSAFTDTAVTSKLITGFSSGSGVVAATDTILQAINKLNGNISDREVLSNKATSFSVINDTLYPTVKAVNDAITSAVTGLLDYRGSYDASGNVYPATGGSGLAGAVLKGDFWIVSTGGTLGGVAVTSGDLVIALQDTPAQTAANWNLVEHDLNNAYVEKATYDANSILIATTDNTPIALTIGASTIVGRKSTGDIVALTAAEARVVILPAPSTSGNLLTSNGSDWVSSAAPVSVSVTTKGDLQTFSTVPARLPVGTNGYILTSDSAETTGLKWVAAPTKATATELNTGTDDAKFATALALATSSLLSTGWNPARETWEYVSVDDPTGIFRVNADVTTKYSAGMRIKFTNGGNTIYGIITVVGSYTGGYTSITFLHQIDPTDSLALVLMANSAITANYYSTQKAPQGFPLSPLSWSVTLKDTTQRNQASPSNGTYYNLGSLSKVVPIGLWNFNYKVHIYCQGTVGETSTLKFVISTSNNSSSSDYLGSIFIVGGLPQTGTFGVTEFGITATLSNEIVALASKTTYYMLGFTNQAGLSSLSLNNSTIPLFFSAVCSYL